MRYPANVTPAVQWHEGMLLSPQHFQQATLRNEQLLAHYVRSIEPFCWGVRHYRLDMIELANGRLRITELEALMPDGTLIQQGHQDDELVLDLTESISALKVANQLLWVCLPIYHPELLLSDRYRSFETTSVLDQNTGDNGIDMPRLQPRLRLMLCDTPPARFTAFPLLLLGYHNETIRLETFIPPSLVVAIDSLLNEQLTRIVVQAREKAGFLQNQILSGSYGIRNNRSTLHDPLEIFKALVAPLLTLEELLHSGTTHPYQLYLHICAMASQLAASSAIVIPPLFPVYDHNNINASFLPVCNFLQGMLDNIQESYQVIAFKYEDGRFMLYPEPDWLVGEFIIGLRCSDRSTTDDTQAWGESCTICSPDRMDSLSLRRILGCNRVSVEYEPSMSLTVPDGMVLFRVTFSSEFIDPKEGVCITNEQRSGIRPKEILFYIKR